MNSFRHERVTPAWIIVVLCAAGLLTGCAVYSKNIREMTDTRQVQVGMSKEEVKIVLGDRVVTGYERKDPSSHEFTAITLKNPYRVEILKRGDTTCEAYFYITSIKRQDGVITDDELTPFVFEQDRLIGKGWSFLNDWVKEHSLDVRKK